VFERLGRFVSSYPKIILIFWALVVLACAPFAQRVGAVLIADIGLPAGSTAQQMKLVVTEAYASAPIYQLLLVADSDVLANTDPLYQASFDHVIGGILSLEEVLAVADYRTDVALPLLSQDGRSMIAIIDLAATNPATSHEGARAVASVLPRVGALSFHLTGGAAVEREIQEISERDVRRAEIYGLPLSLMILLVAFGALVAAGLPLIVAVGSITLSFAALYGLGQFMHFAAFTQSVVTMLGLATGIDYALLMVNRFREELARQGEARGAAATTAATAGRAVAFSGLTVVAALAALLIPPLNFVQSIGLGSMTVVLMSVLLSLTALPAGLALLGHRVNWLRLTRRVPGQRSRAFWRAQAERIMRRPWLWATSGTLLLLLFSAPATQMQLAFAGIQGLTEDTDARQAHLVLERMGLDGLLRSFDVLIDFGEEGFFHPSSVRRVSQFSRASAGLMRVEQVYSPTTVGQLPGLLMRQYYASRDTAAASPLRGLVETMVSQDSRYALVRVFPDTAILPWQRARLESELRRIARELELSVLIGGDYIVESEWSRALYSSFPLAVGLVYLITFLLLGLAFRSLLIPLKSIVLNTFTVGAAFGVITLVFQQGWGASLFGVSQGIGFIETSVPIFIFAIVFGLSMDYEVFLVNRIYEAHRHGMSDREAVVHAIAATGGVISSAALIMIVVFSVFLFSNVIFIKMLSLGLTVAIFLDATVVRLALVPAIMGLAGRWNWWLPRPVARLAERFSLGHD
jgi:putative drug exporter of the RND superfamily